MGEPYSIRIFVPDGDPEGAKIVDMLNWTGIGIAFPRSGWHSFRGRPEFRRSGVYILIGPAEGTDDDLPTVYVGQTDEIGARIETHEGKKDFWDWGYAFISNANPLNRAHTAWLEHSLILLANEANRCHLANGNQPKEPGLSEPDRADTQGFLREMLRVLPLLGVRVFEKPAAVSTPAESTSPPTLVPNDDRDTVVVPAQEPGFTDVFIRGNSWDAIRISGGMREKIKYIAAYQTTPIRAVTHYAPVERIEPYGDSGKFRLIFKEPAKELPQRIPFADAPQASMRSPRYTKFSALMSAKRLMDLFAS
jgi:hypothetical protein